MLCEAIGAVRGPVFIGSESKSDVCCQVPLSARVGEGVDGRSLSESVSSQIGNTFGERTKWEVTGSERDSGTSRASFLLIGTGTGVVFAFGLGAEVGAGPEALFAFGAGDGVGSGNGAT